ncbi:exosortase-associated EpsI family protein [Coraliomargarita sp. SDUM461004]|uniref:Exosortase-associated EpsI family protein n=1 Tax=Thalassobacterium sedimentorum TaxID=3041258 RepID=A0ABU1AHZ1_9BACT|nr:exosortase-associated EpsI family protein [Coraliomargarita sp. SDUM461004]MDQ8193803.1 exosortase-associated EpsI family protein [Coraliomargarita sp. SDUM461004]
MHPKQVTLLFSSLLILILIATYVRTLDLPDASARIANFPQSGPGFSARRVALTEFEKDMLGEAKGYKWIYTWKGLRYAITILDGTHNRQAVHDPRYCFRGAGWTIEMDETITLAGGSARHLQLSNENGRSEAVFFYSTGERVFDAPLEYWMRATVRRWLRSKGGAEPVLVMLQALDAGIGVQHAIHEFLPMLPMP